MILKIVLILLLLGYPVWLFIKLARYGQHVFIPNFERMKREIDKWTGFAYDGRFAYNRPFGKLIYYLLFLYIISSTIFIIYSLAF